MSNPFYLRFFTEIEFSFEIRNSVQFIKNDSVVDSFDLN